MECHNSGKKYHGLISKSMKDTLWTRCSLEAPSRALSQLLSSICVCEKRTIVSLQGTIQKKGHIPAEKLPALRTWADSMHFGSLCLVVTLKFDIWESWWSRSWTSESCLNWCEVFLQEFSSALIIWAICDCPRFEPKIEPDLSCLCW